MDDHQASYYGRTLRLFVGGLPLNFIGLFGDLFITFFYILHQRTA